jgi:hypothetical protein
MIVDLIPVGTTVKVNGTLTHEDPLVCQVIGIRVNKRNGQVLYELGYFTSRRGLLRNIPKKHKLDYWVRGEFLEVLSVNGKQP